MQRVEVGSKIWESERNNVEEEKKIFAGGLSDIPSSTLSAEIRSTCPYGPDRMSKVEMHKNGQRQKRMISLMDKRLALFQDFQSMFEYYRIELRESQRLN